MGKWEDRGAITEEYRISFCGDENLIKLKVEMAALICEYTKTIELCALEVSEKTKQQPKGLRIHFPLSERYRLFR